jgi:hypothetical protein
MRVRKVAKGLTVNAIAGTHVVYFGLDLAEAKRAGCLGFAIQREDHTEDERYWMRGMKTFEATNPHPAPGVDVSSRDHPFQTFQWADYTAKPDHEYTYRTLPLYGSADDLKEGAAVAVTVRTEAEAAAGASPHAVFFNRGAIASQEYARRFLNKDPDEVGPAAFEWLSRGLFEGLKHFLERAADGDYELFGAIYEFQRKEALAAVRAAVGRDVTVHIIYDGIGAPNGPTEKNVAAIKDGKLKSICRPRTSGTIMHNKFFVLVKNGDPVAVWTGSTNLTENGIYGHSNCGHAVDDADVAAAYLEYWRMLATDPPAPESKAWVQANNPAPLQKIPKGISPIFSPHVGGKVLSWYASVAGGAREALFMTFPFGMASDFKQVYEHDDQVLRFALMDVFGNGKAAAQGKVDVTRIRRLPNVIVAVGNHIVTNEFDRWLRERDREDPHAHVRWVHTKYMLVDPLGDDPIVITGSANFSTASISSNEENMLIIRGDKRVADIYLGEFMRLHAHYAFREAVRIAREKGEEWSPSFLVSDDSWQNDYFASGTGRFFRRRYFARTA